MILFIDTTDFKAMRFALIGDSVVQHDFDIAYNENWKTLEFLQQFLTTQKIKPHQLTKIIICSGPGSFTGTRVGATIAQGLAFTEHLPIMTISKNKIPNDLLKLKSLKGGKKITLEYESSKYD